MVFVWRLLSGISGGALMVLAAPAVLAYVPPSKRGLSGGIIFMGVGVGIAASGTLVPLLLQQGLKQTWLGLGSFLWCSRRLPGRAGRSKTLRPFTLLSILVNQRTQSLKRCTPVRAQRGWLGAAHDFSGGIHCSRVGSGA